MAEPFFIQYANEAVVDVRAFRAYDQRKIVEAIERHLLFGPTIVSRTSIKLMVQPFWSHYRLRVEGFRVYYDVDETNRSVNILRILKKDQGETQEEPHETD